MGLSLAALTAGATPKIIPTKLATIKATRTDQTGIVVVKKRPIRIEPPIPKRIPMRPPKNERMAALPGSLGYGDKHDVHVL